MSGRWRQRPPEHPEGRGRGGDLGIAAAYARGSRAAFMDRYAADLKRLAERDDLPADARWFDSHCHLEAWNSIRAGI